MIFRREKQMKRRIKAMEKGASLIHLHQGGTLPRQFYHKEQLHVNTNHCLLRD